MRWTGLILVLAAAGWLVYAAFHFLGSPFPGRGVLISVPIEGAIHFENSVLSTISGGVHAVDFSAWWLSSIALSIALLGALALRGCLVRGTGRS